MNGDRKGRLGRILKIGGATLLGGTLLAVTGGLAAPAIIGGIGALTAVGGTAGTAAAGVATVAATTSGTAALITLLGFGGGGLAGFRMAHRTGGMWPTMLVLRTSGIAHVRRVCLDCTQTLTPSSSSSCPKRLA